MKKLLIAEISNHHHGDVNEAKELIKVAKESGADIVKGQAFLAEDMVAAGGSMNYRFYRKCQLHKQDYTELIRYGTEIGVDVFFTSLSFPFHSFLARRQKYKKIHAKKYELMNLGNLKKYDSEETFISMNKWRDGTKEKIKKSRVMYATHYQEDIDREKFYEIKSSLGSDIGISHHFKSMTNLFSMIDESNLPVIEKHFFLGKIIECDGKIYRDCHHSARPSEFEELALKYKG